MKNRSSVALISAVAILLTIIGITIFLKKPALLEVPDISAISKVQVETTKTDAQRYNQKKLSELIVSMEQTVPLNRFQSFFINKEKDLKIHFIYENGTRDIFTFFTDSGKWYLETEDGVLYQDADFIVNFTPVVRLLEQDEIAFEGTIVALTVPDRMLLQYGMETEYDIRFWFANLVQVYLEKGITWEEAVSYAKNDIIGMMTQYQYAVQAGYEVSEKEYNAYMEKVLAEAKKRPEYAETEAAFEEAGTTVEEYLKGGEPSRIAYTVKHLQEIKREEFRNGIDTVAGVSYDTAEQYWQAFTEHVMYPSMQEYDFSELEKELEATEEAWKAKNPFE